MRRHSDPRTGIVLVAVAAVCLLSCGACGKHNVAERPHPRASGTVGDVLVVVADRDFNDSEFWALHDGLAQAGYRPVVASASGGEAKGMDGTTVAADLKLADAQAADYVGVVLIGGPGASQYFDDAPTHALVRAVADQNGTVGAICLAPVTLARAGLLQGRKGTVWPDNKGDLAAAGCDVQDDTVVVDGQIVTGNGPDAASRFAQAFVTNLNAQWRGATPAD